MSLRTIVIKTINKRGELRGKAADAFAREVGGVLHVEPLLAELQADPEVAWPDWARATQMELRTP
jgi:hypothetical protein